MPANIAILIDAENVDPSFAPQIFSYARSLGTVTIREIYGAGIALNEWADPILENAIHMNMTLRPNRFKNSSDIALVIGAMELLRAHGPSSGAEDRVDALIIASSDSDFSPLAVHLRAAGIDVIGIGEPGRINPMWPKACTEFVALQPVPAANGPTQPAPVLPMPVQPVHSVYMPQEPPAQPSIEQPSPQAEEPAPVQPKQEKKEKPLPPSPKEEPARKAGKKPTIRIAPSHTARVEIIRSFIAEQVKAHGGRIQSQALFGLLKGLPDYTFDQQRSKRKPLDYLIRQFGDSFKFAEGEDNSIWIFEPPIVPEAEQTGDESAAAAEEAEVPIEGEAISDAEPVDTVIESNAEAEVSDTNEAGTEDDSRSDQPTEPIEEALPIQETPSEQAEQPPLVEQMTLEQTGQAEQSPAETEQSADPLSDFLVSAGLSTDFARRVAAIVRETPNLRVAYNELRKSFGSNDGRKFLSLIKDYREAS